MKFWFDFEVPRAKLAFGRVVLFGLLALDALLQLRHAPRYGTDFNVANLPGLDGLGPGRFGYGAGQLVLAYAFVMIACGAATRWFVPVAAVVYNWLYFGSQLDSYQHHYLIAMLLIVACFVPWQRAAGLAEPVKSWALRLMLVELGIVYLWAAISKTDPLWLDGTALGKQLHGSLRSLIDSTIGMKTVATLVPLTEVALGFVWARRWWPYLAPLGVLFHLGIVWSGLEIGLFAWLMIGLYAFVVPDRVYLAVVAWLAPVRALGERAAAAVERQRWRVLGLAIVVGIALAVACRFPGALAIAILATLGLAILALGRRRVAALALAHVLALAVWCFVDRTSTVTRDYYKFWAGTARRSNDPATAETAYRRLTEVAPDDATAHYYLGRLLLDRDAADAGLAELHVAERLDTRTSRAYISEA
ncbi:MAG: HTTM domain-containing protein, partial [Kofleriaceae bacterium]